MRMMRFELGSTTTMNFSKNLDLFLVLVWLHTFLRTWKQRSGFSVDGVSIGHVWG